MTEILAQTPEHVAILGAGPIGLDAALSAADRGWSFTVYEPRPRSVDPCGSGGTCGCSRPGR
ncbi:MAG: hypothetical protein ACRDZ4_14340 [Egibacteraceae bacterium]